MKILFVTDLYPIGDENIAKALFYFVQEWQKQGHEVEVIRANFIANTIIRGRKIKPEKIYYENNTKIYNLNFHTPFLFNVYNKLPKDFSLKNYDVLISHMPCGALMAQKLLQKEKIKYVCGVHASDIVVLKSLKYLLFRNKLMNAYKNADKIAARSPVLNEKTEKIIPEAKNKTFIAYSGIEEHFITNNIKPLNQNKIELITVSSLIKRKNIDVIIKTLKLLDEKYHLTIIGDGNQRKKLENLTKELSLENRVIFTGKIERNKVFDYLKKSDIFVLLSKNETFGLSYLEAMAAGNIVIGKINDGIDGIIKNNENGFLIEPTPKELKKCLDKIYNLNDAEIEQLKQNTRNTILKSTAVNAAENYIKNLN